jgi:hypothetical protein
VGVLLRGEALDGSHLTLRCRGQRITGSMLADLGVTKTHLRAATSLIRLMS